MIDLSFGDYVCGLGLIGLVFGLRVLIWGFDYVVFPLVWGVMVATVIGWFVLVWVGCYCCLGVWFAYCLRGFLLCFFACWVCGLDFRY